MQDLDRYGDGRLPAPIARQVGRGLARIEGSTALGVGRIARETELQATRVEAVAQVGGRALQAIAVVTQLEQQLAQTVPLASSRLQGIADMTALAAAEIVAETSWRVKRC